MPLITTTTDELTELLNLFLPIMVVKNKKTISNQLAIFISAMFNGLFFTKKNKTKTCTAGLELSFQQSVTLFFSYVRSLTA